MKRFFKPFALVTLVAFSFANLESQAIPELDGNSDLVETALGPVRSPQDLQQALAEFRGKLSPELREEFDETQARVEQQVRGESGNNYIENDFAAQLAQGPRKFSWKLKALCAGLVVLPGIFMSYLKYYLTEVYNYPYVYNAIEKDYAFVVPTIVMLVFTAVLSSHLARTRQKIMHSGTVDDFQKGLHRDYQEVFWAMQYLNEQDSAGRGASNNAMHHLDIRGNRVEILQLFNMLIHDRAGFNNYVHSRTINAIAMMATEARYGNNEIFPSHPRLIRNGRRIIPKHLGTEANANQVIAEICSTDPELAPLADPRKEKPEVVAQYERLVRRWFNLPVTDGGDSGFHFQ